MSLGRQTASGALWSIAGSLGGRVIGLIGTLLLTRFLSPEAVGEVGVASLIVLTFGQAASFGFGPFITARPDAGPRAAFHATVYHVVAGALALGILLLVMEPIGPLFNAPAMATFVPGLGLALLCDRIAYIPERVLMREMRFRAVVLARSSSEVVYAAVTVGTAAAGAGAMAVVYGNIAQSGIRMLSFLALTPRAEWLAPCPLTREQTRELFRFGLPAAVAGFVHFISRKWDNLLLARLFGADVMAQYNLAYNLADLPASNVAEQVSDVLAPSFGRMKPEDRGPALLRSAGLVALLVFPLAVGLAAVSGPLVDTIFNVQWQGIGPLLAILAALSIARPVIFVVSPFLFAQNRPSVVMWLEVAKTALLLVALVVLSRFGVRWASVGVGVAFAAAAVGAMWIVHAGHGVPFGRFAGALLRPLLATVPMAAAVLGVERLLDGRAPSALVLAAGVLVGAVIYLPSAVLLVPGAVGDIRAALRQRRGSRSVSPSNDSTSTPGS